MSKLNQIQPRNIPLEDIPDVAHTEKDGLLILAEIHSNTCPVCGSDRVEIRWSDSADLIGFCHEDGCGYFQVGIEEQD